MPRDARPQGAAFLLAQIGAHAATRFGERIGELGLSRPQAGILGLLAANSGISQQELAQLLGMLPSRVVALVDELEQAGLVRRQRNARDRRRNTLMLTTSGTAVLQQVASVARSHEDDVCSALTASERKQLTAWLERIAGQQGLTPGVHPGYRTLRPSHTRR